ncbi:MAG: hypothetical protein ACTHK8_03720 [Ginsengibacter sp.]
MTVKDSVLIALPTGQSAQTLYAEKKDAFFQKEEDLQLNFTRNESGAIDGFVLHQGEQSMKFKKKN